MSTSKDQKTYLQKYLGGPSNDKKKKKKKDKKVIKGKGFKIIDDDLDLTKLRALETDELDIYGEGEDAPQVAGIIDDRPEELKKLEQFKTTSKWRVINQDDGFNSNIQIEEIKQSVKEVEKENEIIFGKMYSDSEDEKERESKKQNDDSDPSPPRKSQKQNNDSDQSPPRKNSARKQNGGDVSSPRKKISKKQGDDRQPMREPSRKYDSDESPPRKQSKEKDSKNESRKNRIDRQTRKESPKNYDSDPSPPRKREHSPRKGTKAETKRDRAKHSRWGDFEFEKNEVEMINQELLNKSKSEQGSGSSKQHDSDVRKKGKDGNNVSDRDRNRTDKSQKRNNSRDSDLSPPRRVTKNTERDTQRRRQNSDSDLSPPRRVTKNIERNSQRRRQNSDSDLSPPRKHRNERDRNSERDRYKRSSVSPPPTSKRMAKTLEGKMAGLQDARQLRKENESFRQREDEVFNQMGDEVSGRNAKAVSRKGKRDTSEDRNKQREKAERQKELDDKYKKWGRGLKQIEDQQERMQDFMHEASKPLARHKGDKDLEDRLKDVERAGDPMLKYIKEKKREAGDLPPERPSYKGSYLPNRFNIPPGYRWDGVDRSNGYEKKYFDNQSKRKAQEEEAYKWSTEDL